MTAEQLGSTAQAMVADGKGILAADESTPTITKRFDKIGIEPTEDNRRAYRETLFTTPGLGEFISGAILFDETIRQEASDGTPLCDALRRQGIMPGIKVDTGAKPLAGAPEETVTEGLDGLRGRVAEYADLGARFAKWRAVIRIGAGIPSAYCIGANAHALGPLCAAVPGRRAGADRRARGADGRRPRHRPLRRGHGGHPACRVRRAVRPRRDVGGHAAQAQHGDLRHPAAPGRRTSARWPSARSAACAATCRRAVPGIVFLSGGQSDTTATEHLNAMNAGTQPWKLSFSYGRALQDMALKRWNGAADNTESAQQALFFRAKFNSAACKGAYTGEMEKELRAA